MRTQILKLIIYGFQWIDIFFQIMNQSNSSYSKRNNNQEYNNFKQKKPKNLITR